MIVRTVAVADPGDLLAHLPEPDGLVWLHRGDGLVGWGQALRIDPGTGTKRFPRAADQLAAAFTAMTVDDQVGVPGTGPVAFGSITFDHATPGSVLTVPRVVLGRRHGRSWLTTIAEDGAPAPTVRLDAVHAAAAPVRVRYAGSTLSEVTWLEAVDAAVRRIRDGGPLTKVVLARDLLVWSQDVLDPRALDRRLAARFPDCYTFACAGLVGATPELLVRRMGDEVASLVLAGTAARGADQDEDSAIGAALLASAKDQAEHMPAVASVRAVLDPLVDDLVVAPTPSLLRLDNVQHLATAVHGRLRAPHSALVLAGLLHPTAAVCGVPVDAAMAEIRTREGMDRGRYAGPVGWVDARGDGEWGIALRCAQLDGTRARLFAGNGIVADSLPEAELEETRIKLLAMQSAFHG